MKAANDSSSGTIESGRGRWSRRVRGHELHSLVGKRTLIILGLTAIAVTQPVLGLFGSNAEFFVAGSYTTTQIVLFALFVAVVPAAAFVILTTVGLLIDRRVGFIAFVGAVGILATAFGLVLMHSLHVDGFWLTSLGAIAFAACGVYLMSRFRTVQLFLSYLAAANLLFVGSFLFMSPASELVAGAHSVGDIGEVNVPEPPGPVVVIVFDELPVTTLMRADGTINEERYPNFADLANVSTWFRNASSHYPKTHLAVPSILTGRLSDDDALPTYFDYPRNLFTLLGSSLPIQRYESLTNMCPPPTCQPPNPLPLSQALKDASLVYGHRVLPGSLRDELPAIDDSWGDFDGDDTRLAGADANNPMPFERWRNLDADIKSPLGQAAQMSRQIEAVDGDPALHFVHVGLPHVPWQLSPSGMGNSYEGPLTQAPMEGSDPFDVRIGYQLHSLQAGAVDALVGQLLVRLRSLPTWDDTTLVVTADHGINFTAPDLGRDVVTDGNRDEVLRVPLFIKAPGQTDGLTRDGGAQTIDILPSLIDLLDIEVDDTWTFDGHSLFDGSSATVEPEVPRGVDDAISVATRFAEQFPHGDDWIGLAAVGDNGDLVGQSVDHLTVADPRALTAVLDHADQLSDLPTDQTVPFVVTGSISSPSGDEPPELLVAVNGRLAGVAGGYEQHDGRWAFEAFVGDVYRDGTNTVDLYEVERRGSDVVLHPVESR